MSTRAEIAVELNILREYMESYSLLYVAEQTEENPDCYFCAAEYDSYINSGFIGWDEEEGKVVFACFDQMRASHDEQEGLPENESKCFWFATHVRMFAQHLAGEVREILAKQREIELAKEKEEIA